MDAAQIHLALNHFPLILTFAGAALLAYALIRQQVTVFRTGALFLVVAALLTIPTYLSGEGAEDVVEAYPGVGEQYIESHEEAAELTILMVGVLGVISLAALTLMRKRTQFPKNFSLVLLGVSLIVFVAVGRTAHLGGQIRHQELRAGNSLPSPQQEQEHNAD